MHAARGARPDERLHAFHEFGVVAQVEVGFGREVTAKTGVAVLDIGGVADLGGLAVADQIQPQRALACDDVGNALAHDAVERVAVEGFAPFLFQQLRLDFARPRQAADVGAENP